MIRGSTIPLFDDCALDIPETEGIKYAGSKLKLIPHILDTISKTSAKTVLDGFSGSTRVSQSLAKSGYEVVCNDMAVWSEVFGTCYLLSRKPAHAYTDLIEELNATRPIEGWFTNYYGGHANGGNSTQSNGFKRPWQIHNTMKLDGIRNRIDELCLSPIEESVALTSLILALDKVDSTLGHYVSYLKEWSPRSYKELCLEVPKVFEHDLEHMVLRKDVFDVAGSGVDLAYYDPPYGSNNEKMPPSRVRYASYYHPWTTICLNDKPDVFGKANRRSDTSDKISGSVFEEFRKNSASGRYVAVEAIEKLIQKTRAEWVLLSYSSTGRSTAAELNNILKNNGELVEVRKIDYQKNVMANMKWTNEWIRESEQKNQEFLFLINKGTSHQ
ncbi:MAG: DNA adenine methylase [Gammaproteobacteria bacterium]|nr:DNA adenine methylase [Gammaproteobacteria bacterium]MCY4281503.1 DNA adenine methylase [Gammaproteobacteria bacterium]MCY4338514.1 DNA adenine methylase [Gammaproteobacteria bacterium]